MKKFNISGIGLVLAALVIMACGGKIRSHADAPRPDAGQRINVMAYGATGDGKTDDSKAIQLALDSARVGDTVYLPKGTYLVHSLRLVSNVHIVADGVLKQPKRSEEHTSELQSRENLVCRLLLA